jgi:hypothetical protein
MVRIRSGSPQVALQSELLISSMGLIEEIQEKVTMALPKLPVIPHAPSRHRQRTTQALLFLVDGRITSGSSQAFAANRGSPWGRRFGHGRDRAGFSI